MKISYRIVNSDDCEVIKQIHSFNTRVAKELNLDLIDHDGLAEKLHGECTGSFRVIAFVKNIQVGELVVILNEREKIADLLWIYVKPEFRLLGIGTNLTKIAINELKKRGFKKVYASIVPIVKHFDPNYSEEAPRRILQKLGFKPIHNKYEYVLEL